MSNQLVKKNPAEGYQNVFPKTWIDAIKDKESGVSLQEILQGFNMYFLSYNGSRALTRCKVPTVLRKEGLWITYVLYDHTVVTEWYNSDQIDDNSWSMDSNWRVASNFLVGDISVSADGYWVINGEKTEARAQGEQGVTPLLRVGANSKLQVSYNAGKAWKDISDYIIPRFRWNQGVGATAGTIQISMDLGKTWTNLSNEITNNLRISRYIGINESLPTSGVAEGTIYMKGPYYDESDTSNANPIYRMWIYAWKGNTLAWQDNGEFTSISTGIVQERGNSTTEVMSQDAITRELTELELEIGIPKITFEQGVITTSGQLVYATNRISSIYIKGPFTFKVKDGYLIRIFAEYSNRDKSSWITNDPLNYNSGIIDKVSATYNGSNYIRIVVIKSDTTSDILPNEDVIDALVLHDSLKEELLSDIRENTLAIEKCNKKICINKADANKVIPVLYLDMSGYTGSADVSRISIRNLMAGTINYWGIALNDNDGNLLVDVDVVEENAKPKKLERVASNGIYIYVEFNWDALPEFGKNYFSDGSYLLTPFAFLGNYRELYNIKTAVTYSPQNLTDFEKQVARDNIGASATKDATLETAFDQGVIATDGSLIHSTTRISSHYIRGPFKVKVKSGYVIKIVAEYSSESVSGWKTNDPMNYGGGILNWTELIYNIPDYAKIVVTKSDGTSEISKDEDVIAELNKIIYGDIISVNFDTENSYYDANSGNVVAQSNTVRTSAFYPLEEYIYKFTGGIDKDIAAVCYYDANLNFLGASAIQEEAVFYIDTNINDIAQIPDTAKYVRFSAYQSNDYYCCVKCYKIGQEQLALKWKDKKWVCVGDSLTDLGNRAHVRYFDYIKINTGITPINYGNAGSGYAKKQEQNLAFYQRVTNIPTDTDVITIFGSFNDLSAGLELGTPSDTGTTTLCGCINTTLDAIFTRVPLAIVGIVTPTPWDSYMPGRDSSYKNYVDALITIARNRSVPCLDLWRCSNFRMDDTSFKAAIFPIDLSKGQGAIHPNDKGNEMIAPKFMEFLNSLLF